MTPKQWKELSGADKLRKAHNVINDWNEDFNQRWTLDQLMTLVRAFLLSEHEVKPWMWTHDQLWDALVKFQVPKWSEATENEADDLSAEDRYVWRATGGLVPTEPTHYINGLKVDR